MLNDDLLKKILKETGTFDAKGLKSLLDELGKTETDISLEKFLLKEKKMPEEMLYRIAAQYYKLPFINLRDTPIRQDILFLIPEPIANSHQVVAFEKTEDELKIVTLNPTDLQTFEFIKRKTGLKLKIFYTNPTSLEEAIRQYRQSLSAELGALTKIPNPDDKRKSPGEDAELSKLAEDIPIVRVVDSILEHAILEGASDIHIEPTEKEVTVRFRVDGVLRPVMTFPKAVTQGIVARIKILSNLKLDEHRLPQDGRFKIENPEYKFSIRVSVLPVVDGEKIVMRMLAETATALTLEQLGFLDRPKETIMRNVKKPHGIILVTGPTGSGKSTTLYSVLGILNTPKVNISTIEDPVEYRMPGVNQSQVNARIGFTFASGLRSLLRQDPNVIMVGEIRDEETAGIAVQAAMTGHLVLGTLHTNDAATALPRLIDMNVPPFLIAFTANVIVGQRLVRKICPGCIRSLKLPGHTIEQLRRQVDLDSIWKTLQRVGAVGKEQTIEETTFWRGSGCAQCNNEGYKGRVGIYEVLEVTPEISQLISDGRDSSKIHGQAVKNGMLTMIEDGFIKAIKAMTTIEEILRVTKD
ncbi:type II/IV secretion system protein [Candidatus Uhrbacteria bacterium]|nr:type II/IV secretion system protein [Candidatus Uhrbacteria bacterium]